jgi:DUF4097 and DUF4098 domain-containing protein YvlB
VQAKTGSGDARILVPSGAEQYDVDAETGSGRIDTGGVSENDTSDRKLRAETGSGDVTVDYGG